MHHPTITPTIAFAQFKILKWKATYYDKCLVSEPKRHPCSSGLISFPKPIWWSVTVGPRRNFLGILRYFHHWVGCKYPLTVQLELYCSLEISVMRDESWDFCNPNSLYVIVNLITLSYEDIGTLLNHISLVSCCNCTLISLQLPGLMISGPGTQPNRKELSSITG